MPKKLITIKGYQDLNTLAEEYMKDPEMFYKEEFLTQLLNIRIEEGEKSAANEIFQRLIARIFTGSASVMDMLNIAEILEKAIKRGVTFQILGTPKRGRKRRPTNLCVNIYEEVFNAQKKSKVPIRKIKRPDPSSEPIDAIGIVCRERKKNYQAPWLYTTVEKYYERGRQLFERAAVKTNESFAKAERRLEEIKEFNIQWETKDE